MRRRFRQGLSVWVMVAAVAALIVFRFVEPPRQEDLRLPVGKTVVCRVKRVVDGDTLLLNDGTRVRLQGIDAPESVKPDHPVEPFGREAARFARRLLAQGMVRLEFDSDLHDRHGRLLAYVWCGDRMLNEELLREGLARTESWFRFSSEKKKRFKQAQNEARRARRGIWSDAP
jgi:micrococcal nuclease